ncbi:MAG: hypothetical protein O0V67_05830 [Methanocorpusculum sp.]|nr:hypothetical protein [Methanocorpusculum sp.]
MTEQRARELRSVIENVMQNEEDAVVVYNMFLLPEWQEGVNYTVGQKVRFGDAVYKTLQAHISQYGWNPADAPSLFAKVLIPDEDVIPEWEQPDSTNAYMKGDKVMYNGIIYESLIDNNVWSPEAYPAGWQAVEQ